MTNKISLIFIGVLFFVCQQLMANALMSGADVMSAKSWAIAVYGRQTETEPRVRNGSTDLDFEAAHEASTVRLTVRPGDNLHYRFLFGVLRDYELEVDSSTFVNKHESHSDGHQYGVGVRWNASPVTAVSMGLALDFSYVHQAVDFDRSTSNGVTTALNERFEQDEVQAAINVSKRWKQLEPYGGLKVNYVETKVVDRITQTDLNGNREGWSPFVGVSWEFSPREILTVEASFADDESLSAGFEIRF